MDNNKDLLLPKTDVVFHALFRKGNEDILKAMIQDIIQEKIQTITIEGETHLIKEYPDEKLGILDLKAILDEKICNIEIQMSDLHNLPKRMLYYWSRLYGQQLVVGDNYNELVKTISIIIVDYELKELKEETRALTKWGIEEKINKKLVLTNDLEIYIIELPKVKKLAEKGNIDSAIEWMLFLDNPNEGVVKQMAEKNKNLQRAIEELEEVSADKDMRRLAELRRKHILDYNSGISGAREEGREEGEKIGEARGKKEGRKEGRKEKQIEIANNMLVEGIAIDLVAKVTGLTIEEINELK